MKDNLLKLKEFYRKHERKILVTTTVVATGTAVVMRAGLKQHDDFLREHDLYDEFYNPFEDEE